MSQTGTNCTIQSSLPNSTLISLAVSVSQMAQDNGRCVRLGNVKLFQLCSITSAARVSQLFESTDHVTFLSIIWGLFRRCHCKNLTVSSLTLICQLCLLLFLHVGVLGKVLVVKYVAVSQLPCHLQLPVVQKAQAEKPYFIPWAGVVLLPPFSPGRL